MSDIARVDTLELRPGIATQPIRKEGTSRGAASAPALIARGEDRLEVSELATYLSKLSAMPPIRKDLVDSVRRQIDAGTYETPEKVEAAMEELLRDLVG